MSSDRAQNEKTRDLQERKDINLGEDETVRILFSCGVCEVQVKPVIIKVPIKGSLCQARWR